MAEPIVDVDHANRVALTLTTLPNVGAAEAIIERLVDERLIACGNIGPGLRSIYRWEGATAREEEVLVLMKSDAANVARLFERVTELHPYTVPELIALPVDGVSQAYGRWVIESTKVSA